MGDLFVYILKSSICLAAFYLFYKVMLSRETFHRFNRIVLVSLFIISLIIPFIEISLKSETPYSGLALNLETLLAMAGSDGAGTVARQTDSWLLIILGVYIIGFSFSLMRALVSIIQMIVLIKSAGARNEIISNGVRLVIHNNKTAPFSWMKFIAISEKDYRESGEEIITHELAHISKLHSADILIAEAVKIIHWFNPAAYLLKQELQNIHEYQADEAVINKGIDAKQYQLLLIKKAVGDRLYTIANSFNHSKLKTRITMISKKKSPKWAALKVLFVLPLSMFAVVAFATEEASKVFEPVTEIKITDFIQKDTIKKQVKKLVFIKKNGLAEEQNQTVIHVKVVNKDTLEVSGNVISWRGIDSDSSSMNKPLIFIDGREVSEMELNSLLPEKLKTINVYKGKNATDKYGEKAGNGVVEISTKSDSDSSHVDFKVNRKDVIIHEIKSEGSKPNTKVYEFKMESVSEKPGDVLYVINGETQDEMFKPNSLDPEKIASMSVFKGDAATKKYGKKGKNGVIEITLKK